MTSILKSSASTCSKYKFNITLKRRISCTPLILKDEGDRSSQRVQGSAKLFADAALEESLPPKPTSTRLSLLENQHKNWDGDESMEDTVLRMLVDKYKPLRTGTIRTAEEKLRQGRSNVVPSFISDTPVTSSAAPTADPITAGLPPTWETLAAAPLLPAKEGHKPWLTTYRVPSHAQESVRLGRFPPPTPARAPVPVDERARRRELEEKRRTQAAGRLGRAKEGVLDYRLGADVKGREGEQSGDAAGSVQRRQPNPVTMRGWASLVEDRIEKARKAGIFNKVSGRGKPLVQQIEETNPFINREEFLMNRILQRNGASPPWVDVQGELEQALTSFREIIRQSWVRRALRTLTLSRPLYTLADLTLAQVQALRDPEWEARERRYHDVALESLNSLVRKYNGLAPYAVRRPLYVREVELHRAYADAAEDILRGIQDRTSRGSGHGVSGGSIAYADDLESGRGGVGSSARSGSESDVSPLSAGWRVRDVIRGWLSRWSG